MRAAIFGGVVASLLFAGAADAQVAPMREAMHEYFDGEAAGSWGFGTAGVVSLTGAGVGLFAADDRLYHGAAYPMAAVGLIQLGAGLVLGLRTHRQVVERDTWLNEGTFWKHERPRMRRVQLQFALLEVVEIGLAVVGAGIAAYGGAKRDHLVAGIGLGLAVEAGSMLVMDHAASYRADRYVHAMDLFER
jgi:hypothetical protein